MTICTHDNMLIRKMLDNKADRDLLLAWLNNPELLQYAYGEDAPWNEEKIEEHFVPKVSENSCVTPCLIETNGTTVGYVQFYPLKPDSYRFNEQVPFDRFVGGYGIDIFIGYPKLWGQGIGTKAVRLLTDHLIHSVGASVVCADPEENNKRSVACWLKAGFIPIGTMDNYDEPQKRSILMACSDARADKAVLRRSVR